MMKHLGINELCIMPFHASARFTGHRASIYALAAGTDSVFYSAGSEGMIVAWNAEDPEEGSVIAKVPGVIYSLLNFENKLLLAGTAHGKIHVIDIQNKKEVRLLQYHHAPVFRIAWNSFNELFYSLDGNGVAQVYDIQLNPIKSFSPAQGKLRSIAFNENEIAIGSADGMIRTYSPQLELRMQWQAHQEGFNVNALYYTDSVLLSGSRDAHLNISDPRSGRVMESIPAHNYAIYTIASHATSPAVIATASRDKTVKVWNCESMEMLQRLDDSSGGHSNSVNDLVWLDADTIISAGDDRLAIAWKNTD
jgi:WD40 repeat protein